MASCNATLPVSLVRFCPCTFEPMPPGAYGSKYRDLGCWPRRLGCAPCQVPGLTAVYPRGAAGVTKASPASRAPSVARLGRGRRRRRRASDNSLGAQPAPSSWEGAHAHPREGARRPPSSHTMRRRTSARSGETVCDDVIKRPCTGTKVQIRMRPPVHPSARALRTFS